MVVKNGRESKNSKETQMLYFMDHLINSEQKKCFFMKPSNGSEEDLEQKVFFFKSLR